MFGERWRESDTYGFRHRPEISSHRCSCQKQYRCDHCDEDVLRHVSEEHVLGKGFGRACHGEEKDGISGDAVNHLAKRYRLPSRADLESQHADDVEDGEEGDDDELGSRKRPCRQEIAE